MLWSMLKSPQALLAAGYGEWHGGGNLSVCVAFHAERDALVAEPDFQLLIEELTLEPLPPVAGVWLEHLSEQIAKRAVCDINEVNLADKLTVLLRLLLACSGTRIAIDVLATDDLLARKAAGRRNHSGLNTIDPSA